MVIKSKPRKKKNEIFYFSEFSSLRFISPYIVSAQSNDRLQRIDQRFFHLPGLYRDTSYCFGSCFEVCTRKKHVRPLKTRAWSGSKREDDEEDEERREGARCLKVPRDERERERERVGITLNGRETSGPRESTRGSKEDESEGVEVLRGRKGASSPLSSPREE